MVLEDRAGNLLGARIATDGQWRFPETDATPQKFTEALVAFEDKRFFYHPGFDPIGLCRAVYQNLKSGKIISGGSTISMQLIRLHRKGKSRTVFEKVVEICLATRLELRYSKKEILAMYAAHAPFGGNVVGIEAASWRYFGKQSGLLTWAEACTLAVLPNSPSLIHPGRNRATLLAKRNRLLDKLFLKKIIDKTTCELAKEEPLPENPLPLPRLTPHLLDRAFNEHFKNEKNKRSRLRTTIHTDLQIKLNDIIARHLKIQKPNEIHNLAAFIMEVESGDVLAYAGNAVETGFEHGEDVDIIKAPRSTGSILKPLLYAMALQEGQILPESALPDIPMNFGGYRPENFMETYDGIASARRAVVRSLNVPLVRLLQDYGVEKFHFGLRKMGLTTLTKAPSHYGLTLVLGGAEGTLWDITNAYVYLARVVNHFPKYDSRYSAADFRQPNYFYQNTKDAVSKNVKLSKQPLLIGAAAAWFAFQAMNELERPNSQGEWEQFRSSKKIAWKTGTSFGFRDAWAVGLTPKYAVGVWVGNADGEGRPGLVGVQTAAPVMFDIFDQLPESGWFKQPFDEMERIPVCRQSGYRASALCESDTVWIQKNGLRSPVCTFHQKIHLDKSGSWQVTTQCADFNEIRHVNWFVLPPVEEFYYKSKNPNYKSPPPLHPDCYGQEGGAAASMQLIYPRQPTKIFVPIDLDGKISPTVFEVAHRQPELSVFWHLDGNYLGATKNFHQMALSPPPGKHRLTLVDERGSRLEQRFEIVGKEQ
ncbi:MAG TPA: penicillin-binding protein 1C [Saprospiraceae bacterium]|nr:penicillin-binding protein 1C [Saprospiraceae bacterium]